MEEHVITVSHLSKAYRLYEKKSDRLREVFSRSGKKYHKQFYALSDINFTVSRGETLGIIGTNGSGKSTLLKIISGVVTPTEGTVTVDGRLSALLELGAGFNPEYTGLENISLNGTMMGFTEAEMKQRTEEIVRFADIGDYIRQPVKNYSSGMFARLAFAVAVNVEPDILIVDEALSVGDAFFQNKCFRKMEQLKEKGITILFVSHSIPTIKQICSRTLWIEHGRQIAIGPSDEICARYFKEQIRYQNRMAQEDLDLIELDVEDGIKKMSGEKLVVPALPSGHDDILSEQVEIISLYISDNTGNFVSEMESGGHYLIHVATCFHQPMENVIVGVVIEDVKGVQLFGFNTYINNAEHAIHVDGPCVLDVSFSLILPRIRSGEYLLSPAVAQGKQTQHKILTWRQSSTKISVASSGYDLTAIELESNVQIRQYAPEDVALC